MADIIERDVNGIVVRQRADGYVNATQLCKAAGKLFGHYIENQATGEFLAELAGDIGIPISDLVQAKKGGAVGSQGTWVHPDVAIDLAAWCSSKFKVMVSRWVRELLTKGSVSVGGPSPDPVLSHVIEQLAVVKSQLAALANRPPQIVGAFPKYTVQERLRYRGYDGLNARTPAARRARQKITRLANALIGMRCEELPDVSDTSGGGATMYYGTMLTFLDEAIDRFVSERKLSGGGPSLFGSMN